jgi:hypothetical protein
MNEAEEALCHRSCLAWRQARRRRVDTSTHTTFRLALCAISSILICLSCSLWLACDTLEHFLLLHFQNAWHSHITTVLEICPIALCLSVSDTSQNKSQDGGWWRLATNRRTDASTISPKALLPSQNWRLLQDPISNHCKAWLWNVFHGLAYPGREVNAPGHLTNLN